MRHIRGEWDEVQSLMEFQPELLIVVRQLCPVCKGRWVDSVPCDGVTCFYTEGVECYPSADGPEYDYHLVTCGFCHRGVVDRVIDREEIDKQQ